MESKLITRFAASSKLLNFLEPHDARTKLATNKNGKKWKIHDTKKLEGLVMHQELG